MAKSIIFGKDLQKEILTANTPEKAKKLALKIKRECENWKDKYYLEGKTHGFKDFKEQLTESLIHIEEKSFLK